MIVYKCIGCGRILTEEEYATVRMDYPCMGNTGECPCMFGNFYACEIPDDELKG